MDSITENAPESFDSTPISEEVINTEVETTENVENEIDVDNMSDTEFDKYMDEDITPDETEEVQVDEVVENLDDMYATQMNDSEAKLDKPILVKFNGAVHKVDSVKELKNLAEKGISLTKKSQDLSDQSKLLETLKANGYDSDSLMRLAEQDNGQPLNEMDDNFVQVNNVANDILQSNYKDTFIEVSNQLPNEVRMQLQQDPGMLKAIAYDVESGLAGAIMPNVNRLMAIQGMGFQDAYVTAGKEYQANNVQRQEKADKLKSQPTTTRIQPGSDAKNVWEMDDSEFDKYFD